MNGRGLQGNGDEGAGGGRRGVWGEGAEVKERKVGLLKRRRTRRRDEESERDGLTDSLIDSLCWDKDF